MAVSSFHVLQQGAVLRALGMTAFASLMSKPGGAVPATPSPWIEATLPPRDPELVRAYIKHVGGDPSAYKGTLPPHFFPQWGFGLAARTLVGIPYPLAKVMNAGCRLEINGPIPSNEPLLVRVRLESIDDDGKRAILTQRVITGTKSAPDALVSDMRVFVPLGKKEPKGGGNGKGKPGGNGAVTKVRPTVPLDVKELAFLRLAADAGLDFAKLTGDFNPVHWVPAYAKSFGFRNVILHGFATMARALEAVNRGRMAGAVDRLATVDVRFTKPLVLPARVGVYLAADQRLFVGDAPGGGAYLEGQLTIR